MTLMLLRSSAPGLPGPYLQENLAPYRIMDQMEAHNYNLALTIGGEAKRHFLARGGLPSDNFAISLRNAGPHSVLIDCELHMQPDGAMPRIAGGPRPGRYAYHLTKSPLRASHFAYGLYCNVFSIFCNPVVIFVADLGLEQVLHLLCFWIRSARARKNSQRARVILITDSSDTINRFDEFHLMVTMVSELRKDEPATSYSAKDVKKMIRSYFDFIILRDVTNLSDNSWQCVFSTPKTCQTRDYAPLFKRELLRAAIAHYATHPETPFDVICASRILSPIPESFEESLAQFLEASQVGNIDSVCLISSALVMDAFSPAKHNFPPDQVFNSLYYKRVLTCENQLGLEGLTEAVKQSFISISTDMKSPHIEFAVQHFARIQGNRAMSLLRTQYFCSLCLVNVPSLTLDCSHRLCTTCVKRYFSESEPYRYRPSICLLCQKGNKSKFTIRPPTAGIRKLELGGANPEEILKFLQELSRHIGLATVPIWELFDSVKASNTGIFFALALFIEEWTLPDCRYHVSRLRSLKAAKRGMSFGGKLTWDMSDVLRFNKGNMLLNVQGAQCSNYCSSRNDSSLLRQHDIVVRHNGGTSPLPPFGSIASKLVSSLFYIELTHLPKFYVSPELCRLNVLCRIPPGEALLALLNKLRWANTHLTYRGSEIDPSETPLCPDEVIYKCQSSQRFSRAITIRALSPETQIAVQLSSPTSHAWSISNCPYRLGDLMEDQSLHCLDKNTKFKI